MLPNQRQTNEENVEKAMPENKWPLDNLAEGLQLFKAAFDFIYNMDPSMIRTLKLKQTVEELAPYRNIFREMKKQKAGRISDILS